MSGGLDRADLGGMLRMFHLLRCGARIHHALDNAVLNQWHALTPHSFAIERRTGLQRMRDIIVDVNVLAKQLRADPIVQKRALVENRYATEVPEYKANNIEDGGRFKNNDILPRRNLARMRRLDCLFGRCLRQARGVELIYVR